MCWLKRGRWKAGTTLGGILLFLVLMMWVPISVAGASERTPGLATPVTGTLQATPTEDATVTALNKEKLQHENDWLWSYGATILSSFISAFVLVSGALIGFWQWRMNRKDTREKDSKDREEAQDKELRDREDERQKVAEAQDKDLKDREAEREKRDEDRFQTTVSGLGKDDTKIGAAVMLRTFLDERYKPTYQRFYRQIFDLAVIYLRLRAKLAEPPDGFSQALFTVFKDSYLRARELLGSNPTKKDYKSLDASFIHLDRAYLARCDLKYAQMRKATLRGASFYQAKLNEANLYDVDLSSLPESVEPDLRIRQTYLGWADLSGTDLRYAKLIETNLTRAKLIKANLREADLSRADLTGTDLSEADLSKANLSGAIFKVYRSPENKTSKANLSGADLSGADLSGADLSGADLSGTDLKVARSLKDTNLLGVKGVKKEQLEDFKARGAIIDENSTTSSSQSTVSPSQSS